jgi:hypothetical protein
MCEGLGSVGRHWNGRKERRKGKGKEREELSSDDIIKEF